MIAAPLQNAPCLFLAEEDHATCGSACLAVIASKDLVGVAKGFYEAGYHLEDVSGLVAAEGAVSAYHFDHYDNPGRATVLVVEPLGADGKASFPSIAAIYQGAEWHERETRDFFGFTYEGNPNLIPLLLPEDMVDTHPLMKAENVRAPLAALFSAQGRERRIVSVADGFTMLDPLPVEAETPSEPAGSPAAGAKPEAKTETAKRDEEKPVPSAGAGKTAPKAGTGPAEKTAQDNDKASASASVTPSPAPGKKTAASSGKKGAKNA